MDIDPNAGILEYEFFLFLKENQYKGILIADDILAFPKMCENFWDKIPNNQKKDLTKIGHWSGTGLIQFL